MAGAADSAEWTLATKDWERLNNDTERIFAELEQAGQSKNGHIIPQEESNLIEDAGAQNGT
eukprot:82723-Pyramimonas_sp.AAC.1